MKEVCLCPNCESELEKTKDGYYCDWCDKLFDENDLDTIYLVKDNDDIPECCAACGGPYPSCTTSCKIFDD